MSPRTTLEVPLGVRAALRLKEILRQGSRPASPLPAPPAPSAPPPVLSSDESGRSRGLRLRRGGEDDDEG